MSLFVVRHHHDAKRCPARYPRMASMLLTHLSPSNAAGYSLKIHGEAVVDDAHTLYLILDGPNQESVSRFMQPFAQAGTVEIFPASSCEAVVTRGDCEAPATG